jgi:phosphoglycerate dehydrogenase-like enzyme
MNLLILDQFAGDLKGALKPKFPEVSIRAVAREEDLGDFVSETDVILTIRISDVWIRKASKLQWIQVRTAGVDPILNLPSLKKEVLVTSTRGIHGPQMSEMAILLMLALSRDFPRVLRNQDQRVWERWPGKLLYRKKVGILGVGAVGGEIARKCKAFGMTVFGIARRKRKMDAVDYSYGPEDLLRVLQEVDYFIIAVPRTPQTQNMIGTDALSSMKSTAFLINIGRGEIVDEEALVYALKTGKIAGAALDTFWTEPLPENHPLWELKKVIITPHVGGLCDRSTEQVLSIFEENLRRFLRGDRESMINLVQR